MSKAKTPKPAAKKSAAKKPSAKKAPEDILRREISDVCRLLDSEGLMFLKRQADVLLHNSRVDNLRREAAQRQAAAQPQSLGGERDLTPPPRKPLPPPDRTIRVEQTTGYTFNIWVGSKKIFFNRDEMREITRICHAAGNPAEGGRRLFAWFRRERTDFIYDTEIGGSASPLLAELCSLITNTYKVKE